MDLPLPMSEPPKLLSMAASTIDFTKVSSGDIDNPGTDLDFSVVGDWSYTVTGGAKTNLTLNNDNTFSFVNKLNKNSEFINKFTVLFMKLIILISMIFKTIL